MIEVKSVLRELSVSAMPILFKKLAGVRRRNVITGDRKSVRDFGKKGTNGFDSSTGGRTV